LLSLPSPAFEGIIVRLIGGSLVDLFAFSSVLFARAIANASPAAHYQPDPTAYLAPRPAAKFNPRRTACTTSTPRSNTHDRGTFARDLLVDYLRERQPALDYSSLVSLANILGNLFWADLERHHPGIDRLHLPAEVADAWKQRLRTVTRTRRTREGGTAETTVVRMNYREALTPVRAFYLDLAHWAVEDPARWGPWVAPCPIRNEEIDRTKDKRRRKSRMDARTRERLPVLPILVRAVNQWRHDAAAVLDAARRTPPGASFTAAGQTLIRVAPRRSAATKIWVEDPATGERRDLGREEDYAFWAFATVEVLRATGIRVEELTELSHHSLVQYRLPTTGELVPLLQIAPSKTDTERLLVVSPELADVLSAIIQRVRGTAGAIPLIAAYDVRECAWLPPMPLLFQRRVGAENRAITPAVIREFLTAALARTSLTEPTTSEPLRFTPHDFRRMFITDAVLNGLPPHIAQIVAGQAISTSPWATRPSIPTKRSRPTSGSSPAGELCGRARNTGFPPTKNGPSSSATSRNARFRSAPAAARSPLPASTSTPASDAPCSGPIPPNAPGSSRSATTSPPESLK
jgi:hypothetical protein